VAGSPDWAEFLVKDFITDSVHISHHPTDAPSILDDWYLEAEAAKSVMKKVRSFRESNRKTKGFSTEATGINHLYLIDAGIDLSPLAGYVGKEKGLSDKIANGFKAVVDDTMNGLAAAKDTVMRDLRGLFGDESEGNGETKPRRNKDEAIKNAEGFLAPAKQAELAPSSPGKDLPNNLGKAARTILSAAMKAGRLEIQSDEPGDRVYLNEDFVGRVGGGASEGLRLREGRYRVSIRREGEDPWEQAIRIEQGETLNIQPQFSSKGRLVVRSNVSGSEIFIDGKSVGRTGAEPYLLEEGEYTIRVSKGEYQPWEKTVELKSDTTTRVKAKLKLSRDPSGGYVPKIFLCAGSGCNEDDE
jgi:hypothetical protein